MGRGLKFEDVKILRSTDKSGKGDRKMGVWGRLQELKTDFAPSFGKFHDETTKSRLDLGFRVILNGKSRVSCTIQVGDLGF